MDLGPCGGTSRRSLGHPALLASGLALGLALAGQPAAAQAPGPNPADSSRMVSPATAAAVTGPAGLAAPDAAATGAAVPGGPRERARRPLSPLAAELAQALEAERRALVALQARFDAALDEQAALAVQREIDRLKASTEVTLLRIQARHARLRGREAAARRIESAIEGLLQPPPVRDPSRRAVPALERRER